MCRKNSSAVDFVFQAVRSRLHFELSLLYLSRVCVCVVSSGIGAKVARCGACSEISESFVCAAVVASRCDAAAAFSLSLGSARGFYFVCDLQV